MKINKGILILFCLLFLSANFFAFNITSLDTEIYVQENGALEIHDFITVSDISSNFLNLNIVPVYDLILKVNNEKYNLVTYNLNTLNIDLSEINIENSLNLEVIYLTDYFSNKKAQNWIINYSPLFSNKTNSLKLDLPLDSVINEISVNLDKVSVNNNRFSVYDVDVTNLDINYTINNLSLNSSESNIKNIYLYVAFFILILLIFLFIYPILKHKKINFKKENKIDSKKEDLKDLLLGLNENEQKIINLLLSENGLSQKKIALKLFLPKGTISRNIKKLEEKGYIEIKKYGVTNKVFLSLLFKGKH